jgi:hypothetical protein
MRREKDEGRGKRNDDRTKKYRDGKAIRKGKKETMQE